MSLFSWLKFSSNNDELPEIFPFPYLQRDFISTDISNMYSRILTDVLERTEGVSDDIRNLLWDNCVASESQLGLVSMLSKAMTDKTDLFLSYNKALKVIVKATPADEQQIRADYAKIGKSDKGVFITFKNYGRTDMIKIYSALDYCSVASLDKSMNLSKAIQFKMSDLRGSTALVDSSQVSSQAVLIATGLKNGKDILIDAKDIIETAKPDLTATKEAMQLTAKKMSLYYGLPASYITGELNSSLGDTGEGDAKKVEQGLKAYYFSIIKPVIELIFNIKTSFRSDDFKQVTSSLELLKTFELTSEQLINLENKQKIINKAFLLPENAKGDVVDPVVTPPPVVP